MGSTAGKSGIYNFRIFVEAANGVNQCEILPVTPTASWQTFTTTFTVGAGDISVGITLQFGAICVGVLGCTVHAVFGYRFCNINP